VKTEAKKGHRIREGHRNHKRSKKAPATASVGERNVYTAVLLQDQSWPSQSRLYGVFSFGQTL